MDRFDRYGIYVKAWGRGYTLGSAVGGAAAAGGIGVYHHINSMPLLSIDEFDRMFEALDVVPGVREQAAARELEQAKEALEHARRLVDELTERERETRAALEADPTEATPAAARRVASAVPDCGPTDRDRREAAAARERLQRLIVADGKTDTGGRSLYESAADEIVRLRNMLRPADVSHREATARLAAVLPDAGQRWLADVAVEEIERLRGEVDGLTAHVAAVARSARARGADEMRELAASVAQDEAGRQVTAWAHGILDDVADRIAALPLSPGGDAVTVEQQLEIDAAAKARAAEEAADQRCAATVRALMAMGIRGASAEEAVRIAEEEGGAAPETAHGAVLRLAKSGGVQIIMGDAPRPDMLRDYIRAMLAGTAAAHGGLSAEDAETLRGAGWWRDGSGVWSGEGFVYDQSEPHTLGRLRHHAARVRAEKAPAAAHGAPGRVSGERSTAAGENSVAPSQGAPQGLPRPPRVEVGQRWRHSHDPGLWTVGDVDRHNDDMLATLRTDDGRVTRVCESWLTKGPYWIFLGPAPAPQGPKRDGEAEASGDPVANAIHAARVRDVQERGSADDLSEPTARDAEMKAAGRRVWSVRIGDVDAPASNVADGQPPQPPRFNVEVHEVWDVERSVHLVYRKDADPRAVLATVAELLGLQPPEYEIARSVAQAHERGAEEGIADVERRAKAKAAELLTKWEELERRMGARASEDSARKYRDGEMRYRGRQSALTWCLRDLRAAFGLPDGQPPTGGEPGPDGDGDEVSRGNEETNHASDEGGLSAVRSASGPALRGMGRRDPEGVHQAARAPEQGEAGAQDEGRSVTSDADERPMLAAGQRWRDRGGFEIAMRPREDISAGFDLDGVSASGALAQLRTGERAPYGWTLVSDAPTDADERWQPGAVWEYKAYGGAVRHELCNVLHKRARFFGGLSVPVTDMTEANGWRYIGRPASEARAEEAQSAEVIVGPPRHEQGKWRLEIADAVDWIPLEPQDTESDARDLRRDAVRLIGRLLGQSTAPGSIGRAHADGVVDGLRRAEKIVRAVESKQYDVEEALHVLREDIAKEIAKAERDAAPADRHPPVDRAALLALAEGWETEAKRLRLEESGAYTGGCADGYHSAAADIRRLLDPPRGPGGGERGPTPAERFAIDRSGNGAHLEPGGDWAESVESARPREMNGIVAKLHAKLAVLGGALREVGRIDGGAGRALDGAARLNREALALLDALAEPACELDDALEADIVAELTANYVHPGQAREAARRVRRRHTERLEIAARSTGRTPGGDGGGPAPMRAGVWRVDSGQRATARNYGESVEVTMPDGTLRWFDAGEPAPIGWSFAGGERVDGTSTDAAQYGSSAAQDVERSASPPLSALTGIIGAWENRGNAFAAEESAFGRGRGQGLLDAAANLKRLLDGPPPFEPAQSTPEPEAQDGSRVDQSTPDKDALNAFAASAVSAAKERGIISNDQLHEIVNIHHRRLWPERYGVDRGPFCSPADPAKAETIPPSAPPGVQPAQSPAERRPEMRNGELTCPCGDALAQSDWPWPPGGRCLYCCTCLSRYEIGTLRELNGPNDPPRSPTPHEVGAGPTAGDPSINAKRASLGFPPIAGGDVTPEEYAAATPLASAVETLRRALWNITADWLEAGRVSPREALARVLACRRPQGDDLAALAALEALCAAPAEEPPAAKAGPRIELRDGAEVTVDSYGCNACDARGPEHNDPCTVHVEGWHVSEGARIGDGQGSWRVLERWPIASPAPTCGAVDEVLGPGLGPVCTRPQGHDGNHEAVDPATDRAVSAWADLPTQKPERVEPGQVWRCVGVDGELEVSEVRLALAPFAADIGLRPFGATGPATVRARDRDMLGLPEWSYVRRPA